MNLSQFRAAVAGKLGLDNTVSGDQGSIDQWLNEGVAQLLMDTHCYVTSQTVTPGANKDYTLAASILEIVDLTATASNVLYGLERVSIGEILEMRRANPSTASSPTLYYALAGHNTVMFYPTPGASDTFEIYYVPVPTALSATADDPSSASLGGIPAQFHKAVEYWACAEGADYDDDQSSAQGQRYRDMYDSQVRKYRRVLRRRGGSLMPRARVGGRRRRYANHDNSVY